MLTKILSISGRPGLYRLISTNKNLNVVESLADNKRIPAYIQEKIVALSDVSIYTNNDDIPLREVLKKIKEKENGGQTSLPSNAANKDYFAYFESVLPDYDKDRVYASDIKKLLSWYNILIAQNIDFDAEEDAAETSTEEQSAQ